ncbi:MAG TPA: TadE/TadG family type IV pilus assembly protein, partial [Planctomycetaceae bacterium]|nr:TadE/TadG family type IV pilus assembly protein [Planctomycetaceae bacterium]
MLRPEPNRPRPPAAAARLRRGSVLVEFALVALVLYLLLAAIITFGHLLYAAQGLQQAADVAARELSRTPLPPDATLEQALADPAVQQRVFSEDFLVVDLDGDPGLQAFGGDLLAFVQTWPAVNQQLFPLMIVDLPDFDGDGTPDVRLLRYPGALLSSPDTPSGFTVGVPLVAGRDVDGIESIRWVPVLEEMRPADPDAPTPFQITSEQRGLVAVRLNYPYQAAMMSSFRPNPDGPHGDPRFNPNIALPNVADDGGVDEINPGERPGGLVGQPLSSGGRYAGTYGG